jgi:MoaA/NifB/PqqE/SkfB family radical SAM enzyme
VPIYVVGLNDGTIKEVSQPSEQALRALFQAKGALNPKSIKSVAFFYDKAKAQHARDQMLRFGRERAPRLPGEVRIEATNHCNAHCTFCPRDAMTRPKGFMAMPLFRKIVEECVGLGIKRVALHNYGESLLDKTLAEKVGLAKAVGIPEVGLITNGSLLDEARATALLDAGLDTIDISLDAARKETFEAARVGLHWDEVTANIRTLAALRKARGATKPHLSLSFIYQGDVRDIALFVQEWREVVDALRTSSMHNWARLPQRRGTVYYPCHRPWLTTTILWDGRVSLCCVDLDGQVVLGDLRTQTLAEVWNSLPYVEARRAHLVGTGPGICQTCDLPVMDAPGWLDEMMGPLVLRWPLCLA